MLNLIAGSDEILDLVYETTHDASVWPVLLEKFATLVGGRGAALRSYEGTTEIGTVVAAGLDAAALDRQFREFATRNPLKSSPEKLRQRQRAGNRYQPGIKMDVEWLPKEDFVRTEYYNDFYRMFDIHSDISIGLSGGGGRWTGVDIYRSERQGPFSADDVALCARLHPHLLRAMKLGRRLSDARSAGEGLAEVFDKSPHGWFLIDRSGRLRHVNQAGRRMTSLARGLRVSGERLTCETPDAARRLQHLINQASSANGAQQTGGSMAISAAGRLRPLSVIVTPLREQHALPYLDGPAVVVCVTDLDAGVVLPEPLMRELFDLTPTETRIAMALFAGQEPGQIASQLEISITTVRTHLSHLYEKTGTTGQSDLSRLLARLATG